MSTERTRLIQYHVLRGDNESLNVATTERLTPAEQDGLRAAALLLAGEAEEE